jgi:methylisocitrate lyase
MSAHANTGTVLDRILESRRAWVEHRKRVLPEAALKYGVNAAPAVRDFPSVLSRDAINIIAELKPASPSRGVLRDPFDAPALAQTFEDAGAAAVHIEDQLLPKKCGHLNDKKLAAPADMAAKIAAAVKARRHLYIIARTDAAASEGLEGAVARAQRYLDAGADAVFPDALADHEMLREFVRRVQAPLLVNMTEFGRTPFCTAREFGEMGYKMVIWPVSALRMAAKAQEELFAAIRRDGGTQKMLPRMQTRNELYATIGYHDYEALDASIVTTVIPQAMTQRS